MFSESEKIIWTWTYMEYYVRDAVGTFERGGFLCFGGVFAKRGGSSDPPNPLVTGM